MKRPLVSVCVTTFNHASFIEQCLRSVLDQDAGVRLEVIVGDDRSTDETAALVQCIGQRDARVTLLQRSTRLGPSANLRDLVERAAGEFICHLDGDDYWLPEKLKRQVASLLADSGLVATYANAVVVSEAGQQLGFFNAGMPSRLDWDSLLSHGNRLNHSSLVYRAGARDVVTGLSEPFIDYRLHVRFMARGQLGYDERPLVGYRWRTQGAMTRAMPTAVVEGYCDALAEALSSSGRSKLVAQAARMLYGKTFTSGLLSKDPQMTIGLLRSIRAIHPEKPFSWWLPALFVAPFRAAKAWGRRRFGRRVFYP